MNRKNIVKFLIALSMAVFVLIMALLIQKWNTKKDTIPFNPKKQFIVDFLAKNQNFSSVFTNAQNNFSYMYKKQGINNPFVKPENVYVNSFFANIDKNEDRYYVNSMYISVFFETDGNLYFQTFTFSTKSISSSLEKQATNNSFQEYTTPVGVLFNKIDKLSFNYFIDLLPGSDSYAIEYTGDTNIFHKSEPNSKRYIVYGDGHIENGDIPEDKFIGNQMPVIYIFSTYKDDNGDIRGDDGTGIYLNN